MIPTFTSQNAGSHPLVAARALTAAHRRRDSQRRLRTLGCRIPAFCLLLLIAALTTGPAVRAGGRPRYSAPENALTVATTAVLGDRSEKVRVQAALVLGRAADARAVPALIRALGDRSPLVRAMTAQSLGYIGSADARPALEVAARDSHPMVRRHATSALGSVAERQADSAIAVQPMGDRTRKASEQMRQRMRGFVAAELRGFGRRGAGGYTVDGAIKTLSMSGRSDLVEVKCGVELVLSTSNRAIVMMSSGEAIVQRQRRQFRPVMQPSMEMEALQHAVRGASEELRQHFAANGP